MQGPQLQTEVDTPVEALPAGTPFLSISMLGALRNAYRRNDRIFPIYRHYVDAERQGTFWKTEPGVPARERGHAFLNEFINDAFLEAAAEGSVKGITGLNEYMSVAACEPEFLEWQSAEHGAGPVAHNPQMHAWAVFWIRGLCEAFEEKKETHPELRDVILIGGNSGVGNSLPVEVVRVLDQFGNAAGVHPYVAVTEFKLRWDDGQWFSGRWRMDDQYYVANGIEIPYWGTEGGAVRFTVDGHGIPEEGFRHPNVFNGNFAAYLELLRYRLAMIQNWNAWNGNRYRGDSLFLTGSYHGWRFFEIDYGQWEQIAAHATAPVPEMGDGTDPPVPPEEGRSYDRVVHLLPQGATLDQRLEVVKEAHPRKESDVLSADDAFITAPELKSRTVYVYDADTWGGRDLLEKWIVRHYPPLPQIIYRTIEGIMSTENEEEPTLRFDRLDWPIGTAEERAAAIDELPGTWIDANGYGNEYELNGRIAIHTGADYNNNEPSWDSDRGAPVYAVADGVVTYAGKPSYYWGNVVIIRHAFTDANDETVRFYARYAALGDVLVEEGDVVKVGTQIATIGQHYPNQPFHLHFDISPTDVLKDRPGDWPGSDRRRISRDYVSPNKFIVAHKLQGEEPA